MPFPNLFCPDCGKHLLVLIETTEVQPDGEYKVIVTCDECENLVYLIRRI